MRTTQPKQSVRCDQCRKKVEYGQDVITVERGVIGPRGSIPLGEECRSTPAVSDGRMFLRTYSHLISVGKP